MRNFNHPKWSLVLVTVQKKLFGEIQICSFYITSYLAAGACHLIFRAFFFSTEFHEGEGERVGRICKIFTNLHTRKLFTLCFVGARESETRRSQNSNEEYQWVTGKFIGKGKLEKGGWKSSNKKIAFFVWKRLINLLFMEALELFFLLGIFIFFAGNNKIHPLFKLLKMPLGGLSKNQIDYQTWNRKKFQYITKQRKAFVFSNPSQYFSRHYRKLVNTIEPIWPFFFITKHFHFQKLI